MGGLSAYEKTSSKNTARLFLRSEVRSAAAYSQPILGAFSSHSVGGGSVSSPLKLFLVQF